MARGLLSRVAGQPLRAGRHALTFEPDPAQEPAVSPYPQRRFYVSADGDEGGDGSRSAPWPVAYVLSGAATTLLPDDCIRFLPGLYSAPDGWTCEVGGVADWPLILELQAGVRWDFSDAAFRDDPAGAWEPVEVAGVAMWRSTQTYARQPFGQITGQINMGGPGEDDWFLLAPHKELEQLAAASSVFEAAADYYVGPGICHHTDDHIYFRGDPLPEPVLMGHQPRWPASTDPRQLDLRISRGQRHGLTFGADHVRVEGPGVLLGCWSMFNGATRANITIDGPRLHPQFFVGRFGGASGVTFRNTHANGGLRQDGWLDNASIKAGLLISDWARSCGLDIGSGATGVYLDDTCVWENFFDGLLGECHGAKIYGVWRCWDDGYQQPYGARNIEIGCDPAKTTCYFGAGPSRDGGGAGTSNPGAGARYFGFAIVDPTTYPIWWGRQGAGFTGVRSPIAMSTHGSPSGDDWAWMWTCYHLTVVIGADQTAPYVNAGPFGGVTGNYEAEHHVKNCIFHVVGTGALNGLSDRFDSTSGKEFYDGNVYSNWPAGASIWRIVTTSTGQIAAGNGLETLAELYASQAYADSLVYSDGWETHGLMLDAQLDANYTPQAAEVQTGAVDLTATGWPGTGTYQARRGRL